MSLRTRVVAAVAATALVGLITGTSQAAPPKLVGVVGPGFTITLTSGGKKVTKLKAGTYRFVISDKASIHDFVLEGPGGFEKQLTGVAFQGTKSYTFKLKKGKWKYYCAPHESAMFGNFVVT